MTTNSSTCHHIFSGQIVVKSFNTSLLFLWFVHFKNCV